MKKQNCRNCGVTLTSDNCKSYRLEKKDYICNSCQKEYARNYQRKYLENPEKRKIANKRSNDYAKKHPEKRKKLMRLKVYRKHGLTVKDFDNQYSRQQGCCAICNKHSLELSRNLDIDHNHITNKNRGLLCSTCNLALGLLKVDEEGINLLQNAIKYIKDYDNV